VKANATTCNSTSQISRNKRQSHGATFTKVLDGRKQPIRGLWQRNERFYAQLKFEDSITRIPKVKRVPLTDKHGNAITDRVAAVAAFEKLKVQRAEDKLPVLKRTPKFSEFVDDYLTFIKAGTTEKMKRASTISKETSNLNEWKSHLGDIRLDRIRLHHIKSFIQKRKAANLANRTVNLDVITFRNVMKHAVDCGHIEILPTTTLRPLKVVQKKRTLFTPASMEKLCQTAFKTKKAEDGTEFPVTKNAQQFCDYIRFLAYSGARRNEALLVRWSDVDFEREQVTIGAEGNSKNGKARVVDFNPKLNEHLQAMKERRQPDTQWLFPSPQRGDKDIPAKTFRESLELARKEAEIAKVGFHDFRHLFISFCVMAGIDFMTIARWVGHQDGGVLIGKVYGHLSNEHAKAQAKRVTFEPIVVEKAA
jgi:integrase